MALPKRTFSMRLPPEIYDLVTEHQRNLSFPSLGAAVNDILVKYFASGPEDGEKLANQIAARNELVTYFANRARSFIRDMDDELSRHYNLGV